MAKETETKTKITVRKQNVWLEFGKYLFSALITLILWAILSTNFNGGHDPFSKRN